MQYNNFQNEPPIMPANTMQNLPMIDGQPYMGNQNYPSDAQVQQNLSSPILNSNENPILNGTSNNNDINIPNNQYELKNGQESYAKHNNNCCCNDQQCADCCLNFCCILACQCLCNFLWDGCMKLICG